MSLADRIADMEADLDDAKEQVDKLADELHEARSYIMTLEEELEDANAFIEYVNKTRLDLRTAFEASKKLEGQK